LTIPSTQFAQDSSSGISSLGINLKSFIFQLITFLIVLMILRRWVYPKLVATLEERRKTLEESLIQAKQTEEALQKAEARSAELLQKARVQADAALVDASSRAEEKKATMMMLTKSSTIVNPLVYGLFIAGLCRFALPASAAPAAGRHFAGNRH
jgi:uncharacterized membrane protein YhiD involved in acid resistance